MKTTKKDYSMSNVRNNIAELLTDKDKIDYMNYLLGLDEPNMGINSWITIHGRTSMIVSQNYCGCSIFFKTIKDHNNKNVCYSCSAWQNPIREERNLYL